MQVFWFLFHFSICLILIAPSLSLAADSPIQATDFVVLEQRAKAGDLTSQHELATAYYQAQKFEQAAVWFERAAEQGNTVSQAILAGLYNKGRGVKEDAAKAYFWYVIALTHDSRLGHLGDGAPLAKEIESKLSSEERAEILKKAAQWKPALTQTASAIPAKKEGIPLDGAVMPKQLTDIDNVYLRAVDDMYGSGWEKVEDIKNLRALYIQTSFYDPYATQTGKYAEEIKGVNLPDERREKVVGTLFTIYSADITASFALEAFFQRAGNSKGYSSSKKRTEQLARIILASGDGKSFETAYQLVSIGEAYVIADILGYLGGKLDVSFSKDSEGRVLSILKFENSEASKSGKVYFISPKLSK